MLTSLCSCTHVLSFPTRRSSDLRTRCPVSAARALRCLPRRSGRRGSGVGPVASGVGRMTTPIRMKPATVARPREGQSCPQSPSPSLTQYAAGALLGILAAGAVYARSEEHTSELQSRENLVCRLLLEKKKNNRQ